MEELELEVVKNFNFSDWQTGIYVDRWTVPHVLSGFVLCMALSFLGFSKKATLFLSIALMVIWEVFELSIGVYEPAMNRFADIVTGLVGYFGARLIQRRHSDGAEKISLVVASLVLLVTSSIGWLEFVAENASRI